MLGARTFRIHLAFFSGEARPGFAALETDQVNRDRDQKNQGVKSVDEKFSDIGLKVSQEKYDGDVDGHQRRERVTEGPVNDVPQVKDALHALQENHFGAEPGLLANPRNDVFEFRDGAKRRVRPEW